MKNKTKKSTKANSADLTKLQNSGSDLLQHLMDAMAKFHQGRSGIVLNIPYSYVRSTDGCDECFDIYGPSDKRPLISFGFWEREAEAEANARRVTALLNACEGIPTEALEEALMIAKSLPRKS